MTIATEVSLTSFSCPRNELAEALAVLGRVAKVGSLPALSAVLFTVEDDNLRLVATDGELMVQTQLGVQGAGNGQALVPARIVAEVVRSLAGSVNFEATASEVRLTSGRSTFELRTIPPSEFPRVEPPVGDAITVSSAGFVEGLRQVLRAASTDTNRVALTGVLVAPEGDVLRMVATDSYRLAVRDVSGIGQLSTRPLLVPAFALSEVLRVVDKGGVEIRVGDQEISFTAAGFCFTSRLIAEPYPSYEKLIPSSSPNRLTVEREPFAEAVKRVKLLATDTTTPVRLSLGGDGRLGSVDLKVVAADLGIADEAIDASYEGAPLNVAFNPGYLLDGIESAGGESVVLELTDSMKPAVLRSVGADADQFMYLVMPVRV